MQKHLCRPGKKVEVLSAFDPAFSAQRKEVPKAYVPLRGYERIENRHYRNFYNGKKVWPAGHLLLPGLSRESPGLLKGSFGKPNEAKAPPGSPRTSIYAIQ